MSQLIETVTATGGHHDSLIGIERVGGTYWKEWDRYLLLRGERAYHIGNICNTCAFFFQRLEGANKSLSLAKVVAALDAGLSGLSGPVPTTVLAQLPPATYDVLLLRADPQLISPHDADDYFDAEQRALWGKDSFRGRDGRTEYYRLGSRRIASNTQLFEFLIPLYPHTRLGEAVERHRQQLTAGRTPTAVAISFLDVKHPANWAGNPSITEHACLAHYLLDGHHKAYAAALTKRQVTLLAFLHTKEGISTPTQRARVIETLSNAAA